MDRSVIGFDRRLELAWLDAAARCAAQGDDAAAARPLLNDVLSGAVGADAAASARANTIGVLMRLWIRVPPERRGHRDRGAVLFEEVAPPGRLWIHWGTALATYPFFFDAASHIGRALDLQGTVSLAALTRRMAEAWGDRTTMRRALQRIVRSMVDWGVIRETAERGTFMGPAENTVPPPAVAAWLLEAVLRGSGSGSIPLRQPGGFPVLFPFRVDVYPRDLRDHPGLELHREGVDREVLALRR